MDWRLHPCYPNSLTPNCSGTPLATEAQYVTNIALIPDMSHFIDAVHALNVSLFFNDHPMQRGPHLSPQEVAFRYDGLTKLLGIGLDFCPRASLDPPTLACPSALLVLPCLPPLPDL